MFPGGMIDEGMGPRLLYLHGFASSRDSKKGVAVAERFAARGVEVERLDLRVPSLEKLDFGMMVRRVQETIGGEKERVVIIGSSLGGLTAARVAERDPRVFGLVLLAPAFGFAERWKRRLGEDGWRAWMEEGSLAVHDHATGGETRVHAEFAKGVLAWDKDDGGWPEVRVPTVVFHGLHDEVVPIEASRRFAEGKRHVRLGPLDDDHDLVSSLPVILEAIEEFVTPAFGGPDE
jgi:uncharacterized protein